jgi:small nuclear ribonucleoprotein E
MFSQPINLLFRFFQNRNQVNIILQNNNLTQITGKISGFDEFMNVVLEDAREINFSGKIVFIGNILLKGDCIGLITEII